MFGKATSKKALEFEAKETLEKAQKGHQDSKRKMGGL